MTEREFAIDVVRRLRQAGYQALWAGGCVRDELLGLTPKDYDVATDARPEEVQQLFRRTVAVGASFGVVEVLGPRTTASCLKVQVATFRSDVAYSDGRRPDAVVFSSARRRTPCAATSPSTACSSIRSKNELIDYVGGQEDLKRARAAAPSATRRCASPRTSCACCAPCASPRASSCTIEPATAAAIRAMADRDRASSAPSASPRSCASCWCIRAAPRGMQPAGRAGPGRADPAGAAADEGPAAGPARPPRPATCGTTCCGCWTCSAPSASFPLALAALLHDVGKPRTVGRTPDRYTFHDHEHVGRRLAEEICLRLKLSNAERERIAWLVEKHQYLCDARQHADEQAQDDPGSSRHPRAAGAAPRRCPGAAAASIDHVEYCERLLREWPPERPEPAAADHRPRPGRAGPGAGAACSRSCSTPSARPSSTAP